MTSVKKGIKGLLHEGGSKLLTLRGYRSCHTTMGYLSVLWHWVCQDCSTKREYLFSLLFPQPCSINQSSFSFMTFSCLGGHQESAPNPRRLEYQTAKTTEPYQC